MSDPAALEAIKRANFDWTMHVQSVWQDPPYHLSQLQGPIEDTFREKLRELSSAPPASPSPLGWVLSGAGGVGKTHLLSVLRADAARQGSAFILVDMTDVNDFWETVVVGYTSSLQEPYDDGHSQYHFILKNLVRQFSKQDALAKNLRLIADATRPKLKEYVNAILRVLGNRYRRETIDYKDAIRALIATNSEDFEISNLGQMWLQGLAIDEEDARSLGFSAPQQRPINIVKALSWLISLGSPAVVAFDQMDPIVRQLEYEVQVSEFSSDPAEQARAKSIISGLGSGLGDLFNVTRRTLTILSCLESSWQVLQQRVLATALDRYETPVVLRPLKTAEQAQAMIAARMAPAFAAAAYSPPYPTWPFTPAALDAINGVTPRELLRRCAEHRQRCLAQGAASELHDFITGSAAAATGPIVDQYQALDASFERYRSEVDVAQILEETNEDQALADLIRTACHCLLQESPLPREVYGVVDTEFTGGTGTKPLHARVRLIFPDQEEREEHDSIRAIQHTHARAFQNRLKLAMTQSGIDKSLSFRRLTLVRTTPLPGGAVTAALIAKFEAAGGRFCDLSHEDVRTLEALRRLSLEQPPGLDQWLRARRPVANSGFGQATFAHLLSSMEAPAPGADAAQRPAPAPPTAAPSQGESPPAPSAAAATRSRPAPEPRTTAAAHSQPGPARSEPRRAGEHVDAGTFPLGRRLLAGTATGELSMPIELLEKHTVVLAGAGSGKTVLLKRMVEEAALRGVPSIIIDAANDLAAIGDRWPVAPAQWTDADAQLAERYHREVDKIIWTPGNPSGNPLRLELLPDLTAIIDEPQEFDSAITMVAGALAEILKLGPNNKDQNKRGILRRSLRFYIEQGGVGLLKYIELLADLPPDACLGIDREPALARQLSDSLRVLEETDPMISDTGEVLDPAVLLGDDASRQNPRVSVINLGALGTMETQQRFVNQLATTLFVWIKKHPTPPGRALRGLLVIDEAKDLVPTRHSTPCKESLIRLAAQARKYHLGVVFATQNPREIDNAIIGNCSTQYYGKANSPAAMETIRDQLAARGGSGEGIGRLERGTFYVYNADAGMRAPEKVQIPMCLSHHTPLDSDEVLQRASVSRELLSNPSGHQVATVGGQ